jgi:hypothetical protein
VAVLGLRVRLPALHWRKDPVSGAGWLITDLVGINNSGQIAANALKGGFSRAIILTPVP